ncbi:hypothetical protein ACRHK7_03140 [Weissella tructae]|uniref:Uncharacterized protein n=2 Tax=Weissella TaxID=46255 RepID=A0A075U7S5_9LACO|nr:MULTISPECIES: hypothetical protein [Weissella]AIG66157.1 hypothetical protein WS08_1219 [Weissella tructae]AIM63538.1 hypothetical protein WS74_1289 [Weissella ceti]AIM64874.1 hypothetical protein WS105_1284 [Weissella ceti]ELA07529.1 hypothetical protein WCNC_03697 [Weissella ceti NC36]QVV91306.1 hypothetical protein KHQ32_06755 [Weissella tructae]
MKNPLIWPAAKLAFNNTSIALGWSFLIFLVASLFFPNVMMMVQKSNVFLIIFFIASFTGDFSRAYRKAKNEA